MLDYLIVLSYWILDFLPVPRGDAWLLVDYCQRLIVIALLLALPRFRGLVTASDPFRWRPSDIWLAVILGGWTILVFKTAYPWAWHFISYAPRPIAPIDSSVLWAVDNSIGLMLVAWSEELLYTVAFLSVAKKWPASTAILAGAALFALDHFGRGPALMLAAFLSHIPFLVVYRHTRSFAPIFWGHYSADLLLLA